MRTVAIVQARVGSRRLPAKTLLRLPTGRTILEEVLFRAKHIDGVDDIVCAIPKRDDVMLVPVIQRVPWVVAFVSTCDENDLLTRYLGAAEMTGADIIVRLTADCPLLDPAICSEIIKLRNETGAAYASNSFLSRSGMSAANCEVFTIEALRNAHANPWNEPEHKEHVGPAIKFVLAYENIAVLKKGRDLSVDTEDDFREVCRYLAEEMREAA